MDAQATPPRSMAPVRVLTHIKKLDESPRALPRQDHLSAAHTGIVEPEALARLGGSRATLGAIGKRMRCSKCGTKGAEVVAVEIVRIRGRGSSR
jgi:hypothetical protein